MGLRVSHECWDGPYSSFHEFRIELARAVGIYLPAMEGFADREERLKCDPIPWSSLPSDPLHELLNHSDCEGIIESNRCIPIADRIDAVAGRMRRWQRDALQFASGLRLAASLGDPVNFH